MLCISLWFPLDSSRLDVRMSITNGGCCALWFRLDINRRMEKLSFFLCPSWSSQQKYCALRAASKVPGRNFHYLPPLVGQEGKKIVVRSWENSPSMEKSGAPAFISGRPWPVSGVGWGLVVGWVGSTPVYLHLSRNYFLARKNRATGNST